MNSTAENIMRDRIGLAEQRQGIHYAPRGKENREESRVEKIAEIILSAKTVLLAELVQWPNLAELGPDGFADRLRGDTLHDEEIAALYRLEREYLREIAPGGHLADIVEEVAGHLEEKGMDPKAASAEAMRQWATLRWEALGSLLAKGGAI